jgi:UDP-N-acetylmuramyl pentapeptide phosphotransferase/UDP-N-acetylglucosamine-1-phosphate transferase
MIYITACIFFLLALWLYPPCIRFLERLAIIDVPDTRKNHSHITPRGGGILIVAAATISLLIIALTQSDFGWWIILGCFLSLAAVSFTDDRKGLPASIRFITQFITIALTIIFAPFTIPLPYILPIILAGIWWLNLYNFMDGINGITGCQTIYLLLACSWFSENHYVQAIALPVAAVTLAFLRYNIIQTRIFLGDIGSITLGYLTGLLLLITANTHLALLFILPAYYIVDATTTLVRRLLAGKNILQAHSEHAYQLAVRRRGYSHVQVVIGIAGVNLLLFGIANAVFLNILPVWLGIVCAYAVASLLYFAYQR